MTEIIKEKKSLSSKRGRPVSAYGLKKNRSLYLSDVAYEELQALAHQHGTGSLSEFMEKIGHREMVVESQEEDVFADVPIIRQLRSLVKKPNGALCSTLAFAIRLAGQLGLPQEPEFLHLIILDAMVVLFYLGYLYPNQTIDSPMAWLRWYILHILENCLNSASHLVNNASQRIQYLTEVDLTNKCIATIFYARKELDKQDKVTHLYALKLRMWPHELSISQIQRICKAQDVPEMGFDLIIKGMTTFRYLWLHEKSIRSDISRKDKVFLSEAEQYCRLLQKDFLSEVPREELKVLLKRGLQFPDHDFWANEIDYFLGCHMCKDREVYEANIKEMNHLMSKKFEDLIKWKKENLDRGLLAKDQVEKINSFLVRQASQCLGFNPDPTVNEIQKIRDIVNPIKPDLPQRGPKAVLKQQY